MKRWAAALLVVAAIAAAAPVAAQEAPADTLRLVPEVTPSVTKVGERVTVRVAIPALGGETLAGPPAPLAAGDVDVIASAADSAGADSSAWRMTVALFRTGEVPLPPLPFRVEGGGGSRLAVLAPYVVSVEATVAADSALAGDIRDIHGPIPLPTQWRWGLITLAATLVAALIAGLVWLRRRPRRGAGYVAPAEPPRPAHEVALAALDALEREALPRRGMVPLHYVRLSRILREYMERRFGFPAVESTTWEIREALARRPDPDADARGEALALLDEADLVKFAKVDPGMDPADAALARSRRWVERTTRRPEPAAPPAEPLAAGEGS